MGAYEIESLNKEIIRIITDDEHYGESNYPFHIKPNFSTLGSFIETKPPAPLIGSVFDDSIGNLLGFDGTILFKEYNLSKKPVDILSFDNIFLHTNIAQGLIFKGKRTGIIHNFTISDYKKIAFLIFLNKNDKDLFFEIGFSERFLIV